MDPVSIILADDHEMLRDGFRAMAKKIPGIRLVASVENGLQLLTAVEEHRPKVVITDIKMPVVDGIEATKAIKASYPSIKVIGLSSFDEQLMIMDLLDAGADGYLLKNVSTSELQKAIDTVLAEKPYYSAEVSEKIARHIKANLSKPVNTVPLSNREIEVMKLMVGLKTSKEISDTLFISTRTVERHRHSIYKKTGTNSIAGVVLWARKNGYLE